MRTEVDLTKLTPHQRDAQRLAAAEGWSPSHNVVKLGRTG